MNSQKVPSKIDYSRNGLLCAALYVLHRNFNFNVVLKCQINGKTFYCFQFQNHLGEIINYLSVDRASEQIEEEYNLPDPTLDEWINACESFMRSGFATDQLTIVPLVELKNGQRCFHTLTMKADDDRYLQAYLIQPQSNTFTLGWFSPPSRWLAKLKDFCFKLVNNFGIKQLQIKTKPVCDDLSGRTQHIHFLEAISSLPKEEYFDGEIIKNFLQNVDLSQQQINYADFVSNRNPINCDTQYQRQLSKAIKKENLEFGQFSLNDAIKELKVYKTCYEKQTFTLFGSHTRQLTVQGIIKILQTLLKQESKQAQLKAAILLISARENLNTFFQSALSKVLDNALAHILNCQTEYEKIDKKIFGRDQAVKRLFNTQLALLPTDQVNMDFVQEINQRLAKIHETDASIAYKFASAEERRIIDETREAKIRKVEGWLHLILTKSSPRAKFRNLRAN